MPTVTSTPARHPVGDGDLESLGALRSNNTQDSDNPTELERKPDNLLDHLDLTTVNDSVLDFSKNQCPICGEALPDTRSEALQELLQHARVNVIAFHSQRRT